MNKNTTIERCEYFNYATLKFHLNSCVVRNEFLDYHVNLNILDFEGIKEATPGRSSFELLNEAVAKLQKGLSELIPLIKERVDFKHPFNPSKDLVVFELFEKDEDGRHLYLIDESVLYGPHKDVTKRFACLGRHDFLKVTHSELADLIVSTFY